MISLELCCVLPRCTEQPLSGAPLPLWRLSLTHAALLRIFSIIGNRNVSNIKSILSVFGSLARQPDIHEQAHTHTHTHARCVEHKEAVTVTVNTGGRVGLVSGFYSVWLRAISATSYWLWHAVCHSLCNPSKLVIYPFGTLLTLPPSSLLPPPSLRQFHPTVSPPLSLSLSLPLSSAHPPSLLRFSLVSHLLSHLPLFIPAFSRFLSVCDPPLSLSFSSPPRFFLLSRTSHSLENTTFCLSLLSPPSPLSLFLSLSPLLPPSFSPASFTSRTSCHPSLSLSCLPPPSSIFDALTHPLFTHPPALLALHFPQSVLFFLLPLPLRSFLLITTACSRIISPSPCSTFNRLLSR